MDSNLVIAIVTSVSTAATTAGVSITALPLVYKRIDLVETGLDRLADKMDRLAAKMDERFAGIDARLEKLTGPAAWHRQAAFNYLRPGGTGALTRGRDNANTRTSS